MDRPSVKHVRMKDLPYLSMGIIRLHPFSGEHLTVVRVEAPAGSMAPRHQHPHEQVAVILSGKVRFSVGAETYIARPGDLVYIPSDTPHEAEALEDAVFLDIFHPVREDYMAELRKQKA